MNRIAIMQPYLFPYIGYFQLIDAIDTFVFFDSAAFIKKGWINRNRILIQKQAHFFTIPCRKISQNKLIVDTQLEQPKQQWQSKLLKSFELAYKKAPYFNEVMNVFTHVIYSDVKSISELAALSLKKTSEFIGLQSKKWVFSSDFPEEKALKREDRLIQLAKLNHANRIINPVGGGFLYNPTYFEENQVHIHLLNYSILPYKQWSNMDFLEGLSILDVLFFNSPEIVRTQILPNYSIISALELYEKSVT